jgi:nucleoside-diphosphate-sugar epimerase
MKRVLVTGASGFIGYHCLAPLIARGYEVHAIQSRTQAIVHPGVTWHNADLFEPAAAAGVLDAIKPTHLLHLAWYVVPGKVINYLDNSVWVQRSIDLLRAFHAAGGKRITFGGSCYEYDWRYGYCSEELTPTRPDTYYGICKNSLHDIAAHYCKLTDISYSWGRIFFLYGPREHPDRLVSSVIRNLLAGKPAPCSHGEQIRDYMSVEDVADAMVALLDSEFNGPSNIGCGEPIALKTIVTRIGELLERPDLIELGALPARANDLPLVLADTTRLFQTIGWKPRHDLSSGLQSTIDWWRAQLRDQESLKQ